MIRAYLPLAFLGLNFAALQANEIAAQPQQTNVPPKSSSSCGTAQQPMRVTARHIEAQGVGYDRGYTTLEGFFSPVESWKNEWTPFLDLRGHVFNNGKFAANAGIGVRYLNTSRLWGVNFYYDYRNTTRLHYNQISMGFESLGRVWDFRLNGYLPVGTKASRSYDIHFERFRGHSLYVSRKREFVMGSVNAEAGLHVDSIQNVPLYFAAGPYYLHGQNKTAWGGEIRARADIYEYLTLEANTSYDSAFHWIGQGQVGLNFYFGGKRQVKQRNNNSCARQITLANRAIQRVDRNEIIPVDRRSKAVKANLPYSFIFVNNLSSSLGTWESPYPTLQQAEIASTPNDVIYVLPGSGAPYIVTVANGFSMQEGQKLWGASTTHNVDTQFGTIEIPALANTMPQVENTFSGTANVITMTGGGEVSGMHVLGSDVTNGIFASANGTGQLVSINHNLVEVSSSIATTLNGIYSEYLGTDSLTVSITDNQCFNLIGIGSELSGINVFNDISGSMNAFLSNNQCSILIGDEVYGINITNVKTMNISITENKISYLTATTRKDGFSINNAGRALTISLINNQLSTSAADYGLRVVDNGIGSVCATVIGNNTGFPNTLYNTLMSATFNIDPSSGGNTPPLNFAGLGTITTGSCD